MNGKASERQWFCSVFIQATIRSVILGLKNFHISLSCHQDYTARYGNPLCGGATHGIRKSTCLSHHTVTTTLKPFQRFSCRVFMLPAYVPYCKNWFVFPKERHYIVTISLFFPLWWKRELWFFLKGRSTLSRAWLRLNITSIVDKEKHSFCFFIVPGGNFVHVHNKHFSWHSGYLSQQIQLFSCTWRLHLSEQVSLQFLSSKEIMTKIIILTFIQSL